MPDIISKSTIGAFARGDVAAFRRIYDHYGVTIYRLAAYCLGSNAHAEDVVRDVFAKVLLDRVRFASLDVEHFNLLIYARLKASLSGYRHRKMEFATLAGIRKECKTSAAFKPGMFHTPDWPRQLFNLN